MPPVISEYRSSAAMCNAYNHPSWCTCGFGPGYGAGGRAPSGPSLFDYAKAKRWRNEDFCHKTTCPKCGKNPVWFIQHNRGTVWVEYLDPPWPKHPCFDTPRESNDPFQLLLFDPPAETPLLAIIVQTTWHPSATRLHLELKCQNDELGFLECDVTSRAEDLDGSLIFIYRESRQVYLAPLGHLHTTRLCLTSEAGPPAPVPPPQIQNETAAPAQPEPTCKDDAAQDEQVPADPPRGRLNWTTEQVAVYAARLVQTAKAATASIPVDSQATKDAKRLVLQALERFPRTLRNLLLHHFEKTKWRQVVRQKPHPPVQGQK